MLASRRRRSQSPHRTRPSARIGPPHRGLRVAIPDVRSHTAAAGGKCVPSTTRRQNSRRAIQETPYSPVARPAARSVAGRPRPIRSEPWFPRKEEPVLAGFELTPAALLDDHRQRAAHGGALLHDQRKQSRRAEPWTRPPAQEEEPGAPPARSLRDERDHRAADRGVIATDGKRSCAGADRRDRNATNGIISCSRRGGVRASPERVRLDGADVADVRERRPDAVAHPAAV